MPGRLVAAPIDADHMNASLALLLFAAGACTALAVWLCMLGVYHAPAKRVLDLKVTRRVDHSDGVFTLVLQRPWVARMRPLPRFAGGQSVQISLPDAPVRRRYSLARWTRWPFRYELTVRQVRDGRLSSELAARARVGMRVCMTPPNGRFILPQPASGRAVMLAGGVGITPLLAMIEDWSHRGGSFNEIHCYWQVRHQSEWVYQDVLDRIARQEQRLHVHYWCSRPAAGDGRRIDIASIAKDLGNLDDVSVFICAGNALSEALIAQLRAAGVPDERIHFERFGVDGSTTADEQWQLTLDGRQITFQGHASVLDALEDAGVAVEADCRSGACGDCRLRLVDGTVNKLIEPEFAVPLGQILACCCSPKSNLLLERVNATGATLDK